MTTATTKQEYLEAQAQLAPGYTKTIDANDHHVGATAQTGIPEGPEGVPGQVFAVHQLPDPAVAIAYGLPPVTVPDHLIVESEDAASHPQGLDAHDMLTLALRDEIGTTYLDSAGKARTLEDGQGAADIINPVAAERVGNEQKQPVDSAGGGNVKSLDELKLHELQDAANAAGVDSSGTKADIYARLEAEGKLPTA